MFPKHQSAFFCMCWACSNGLSSISTVASWRWNDRLLGLSLFSLPQKYLVYQKYPKINNLPFDPFGSQDYRNLECSTSMRILTCKNGNVDKQCHWYRHHPSLAWSAIYSVNWRNYPELVHLDSTSKSTPRNSGPTKHITPRKTSSMTFTWRDFPHVLQLSSSPKNGLTPIRWGLPAQILVMFCCYPLAIHCSM